MVSEPWNKLHCTKNHQFVEYTHAGLCSVKPS